MPTRRVVASKAASCIGGSTRTRLGKSPPARSPSKYRATLPEAAATSSIERSRHVSGSGDIFGSVPVRWCRKGLQEISIHTAGLLSVSSWMATRYSSCGVTRAADGLPHADSCLKIGFDRPQFQRFSQRL